MRMSSRYLKATGGPLTTPFINCWKCTGAKARLKGSLFQLKLTNQSDKKQVKGQYDGILKYSLKKSRE